MFLDQILRSEEVKEFEAGLAEHQLAQLEVDKRLLVSTEGEVGVTGRRAPRTVLDRAVMEHNVLACAKVSWAENPSRNKSSSCSSESEKS